jgi:hypothetical protein
MCSWLYLVITIKPLAVEFHNTTGEIRSARESFDDLNARYARDAGRDPLTLLTHLRADELGRKIDALRNKQHGLWLQARKQRNIVAIMGVVFAGLVFYVSWTFLASVKSQTVGSIMGWSCLLLFLVTLFIAAHIVMYWRLG